MSKTRVFKTMAALVTSAILAALSIVLTRFLSVQIGDTIRISFGNFPLLLAGLLFGPAAGGMTALVADFAGTVFFSAYTWNPVLAVTYVLIGLLPPLIRRMINRPLTAGTFFAMLVPTYIIGPVVWSTVAISLMYGTPFSALIVTRGPVALAIAAVEIAITFTLIKAGAFRHFGISITGGEGYGHTGNS